jgi:CPA2 family monovalent cation:H+ antiporter-2
MASVEAIPRERQLIANPKSITSFRAGDRVGVIGDKEELEAVEKVLAQSEPEPESSPVGVEWET